MNDAPAWLTNLPFSAALVAALFVLGRLFIEKVMVPFVGAHTSNMEALNRSTVNVTLALQEIQRTQLQIQTTLASVEQRMHRHMDSDEATDAEILAILKGGGRA